MLTEVEPATQPRSQAFYPAAGASIISRDPSTPLRFAQDDSVEKVRGFD
jgi:hypothetical protein